MLPFAGLIIGIIIGGIVPFNIPIQYSNYVAVAILAALDSVFGGLVAHLQKKFEIKVFITGFFGNALLAGGLAYIGDRLNIQLQLAAIFAFGNRLFLNFAILRRILIDNALKKKKVIPEN